jgi:4-hydroxybenzoate polyprenyltransferase
MVDRDDDIRMGAKSTAILFGDMDLVAQGILYASFLVALAMVGHDAQLGAPYWWALGLATALVAWEFFIARHRDRDACFRAFLHNHWVGATVFAGIATALWRGPA